MSPINTFNIPTSLNPEFTQGQGVDNTEAFKQQYSQQETFAVSEEQQNIDYVARLHQEAYNESVQYEQSRSPERDPQTCIDLIEATAVNVERLRSQYGLAA